MNERQEAWEAVARACREDTEYRARMESDPKAALAEAGVDVGDCEVRVVVDTDEVLHMALPIDPNAELADERLQAVAGGVIGCNRGAMVGCACIGW